MESEEESSLDQADLRHAKATQEATFARLSRHSKRPEVITTPGPYRNGTASPFRDRRVLMTMRSNTGKRANPITEVKTCAPDVPPGSCERAYKFTQPKSFSATFSLEPRFGWKALKSVAPCNAVKSQFDIEKAWKATQAKSYTVNFNLATSSTSFPKDPLLLKYGVFFFFLVLFCIPAFKTLRKVFSYPTNVVLCYCTSKLKKLNTQNHSPFQRHHRPCPWVLLL